MHLVFERSNGRFKSNCNVLTLAWIPYYDENKFKSALFDYHQKQLIDLTGSIANNSQHNIEEQRNGRSSAPLGRAHRYHHQQQQQHNFSQSNGRRNADRSGSQVLMGAGNNISRLGQSNNPPDRYLNARVAEYSQRHSYVDSNSARKNLNQSGVKGCRKSGDEIANELNAKYGLLEDFGWLAVGNVGKLLGITLTSVVQASRSSKRITREDSEEQDLINFNNEIDDNLPLRGGVDELFQNREDVLDLREGLKQVVRPDNEDVRSNYNLRGHLDEVIIVKWNELYQKLASVDSKGNVLIWCKVNGKFTIQTPFYNRSKTVADFKWSHDGKIALICYTDSFILVGSSSGQRHWHSMLNLDDYHITSASWTPNDDQLLLGVSNGNVLLIDLFRSDLTELEISQSHVRTMCWSTSSLTFRHFSDKQSALIEDETGGDGESGGMSTVASMYNTVVNHRRLSRDCSVFSRYRFCSQGPQQQTIRHNATTSGQQIDNSMQSNEQLKTNTHNNTENSRQRNILALDFANNTIKLFNRGLNDPKPKTIQVNQESYIMQWSTSGKILAVGGFNIHTTAPSIGYLKCKYLNTIKFYDQEGQLVYEYAMEYTRYPITALTWAHQDSRLFVATGPRIHYAKVFFGMPSLSLLAESSIHKNTMLSEKYDILNHKVNYQMQMRHQVWTWQSECCPINLKKYFKSNHDESSGSWKDSSWSSLMNQLICNNINVFRYQLPMKLQLGVDHLFLATIKPPFDENWSLGDIIWHVPNQGKRYNCTLVCYSSEREMTSLGQYRMSSFNRMSDNQAGKQEQYKIFVLYVEFLGSLIPILRARRVGFLKPEFVIFNPEDQTSKQGKYRKISDLSQAQHNENICQRESSRQEYLGSLEAYYCHDNISTIEKSLELFPSHRASSIGPESVMSEAEHYYNFDVDSYSSSRRPIPGTSRANLSQNDFPHHHNNSKICNHNSSTTSVIQHSNPYLWYMMQQQQIKPPHSPTITNEKYRPRTSSMSNRAKLTENRELVRIKSNVWGTKFKVVNVGHNSTGRDRAILGTMVYKASILHLQPRRILMNMHNMSNYCILCSMHHHTSRKAQLLRKMLLEKFKPIKNPSGANLMDSPSKLTSSNRIQNYGNEKVSVSKNSDKVILNVGDGIRIAPKPEWNQQYRIANKYPKQSSKQATPKKETSQNFGSSQLVKGYLKGSQLQYNHSSSETHQSNRNKLERKRTFDSYNDVYSSTRGISSISTKAEMKGQCSDDVLTLSLEQGDQIKVEMSSLNALNTQTQASASEDLSGKRDRLIEFLGTNKTLKSIQTITKMIMDLSSKAEDESSPPVLTIDDTFVSPTKIAKGSTGDRIRSPSSKYVPPDTPIHRPRRIASHLQAKSYSASFDETQSAHSSPCHGSRSQIRRKDLSSENEEQARTLYENPLPPPPLATPIRRRLSATAKRLFDTSLRMIQMSSEQSGSEMESEENEPLVSKSRRRTHLSQSTSRKPLPGRYSQPQTPLKSLFKIDKASYDIDTLRDTLLRKLRNENEKSRLSNSVRAQTNLSSMRSENSLSSSDSLNLDDTEGSTSFSNSNDSLEDLYQDTTVNKNHNSILSSSLKDVRNLKYHMGSNNGEQVAKKKRIRRRKRMLCSSSKCPCAKEIKMCNRAPVWNDQSQVYQLDFDGRVTQESAKNLQIDFEGKLALQFGRLDRCTYTLDYKYPFNAVQAMSVALASLTQRLK